MESLLKSIQRQLFRCFSSFRFFGDIPPQKTWYFEKIDFFGPDSLCATKTKWKNVKYYFLKMSIDAPRYQLSRSEDRLEKSFLDLYSEYENLKGTYMYPPGTRGLRKNAKKIDFSLFFAKKSKIFALKNIWPPRKSFENIWPPRNPSNIWPSP